MPAPATRYTIGQFMVLVAALAFSFGLSRYVLTGPPGSVRVAISLVAWVAVLLFLSWGRVFWSS
ncbi:MAG: hypothetical protein U0835_12770 [Isosphaeraceae bacterium]